MDLHPVTPVSPVVEIDDHPVAAVVHVSADLGAEVTGQVRTAVTGAVERCGNLVLDLAEVATVDPIGLGMLVRAHRRARQHHAVMCLVAPSRYVLTVLHTMHLDRVFPIFDDCPSALAWLHHIPTSRPGHPRAAKPLTARNS